MKRFITFRGKFEADSRKILGRFKESFIEIGEKLREAEMFMLFKILSKNV